MKYFLRLFTALCAGAIALAAQSQSSPAEYSARTDRKIVPYPDAPPAIGPAGSVITDPSFGSRIARITDSSKTKTGMVLGTPSHMSPEQLSGLKVDGRSDLFSLAVTLYQLLCGALPFMGNSMAQVMFKIANEPPTDILSVRPDLPPALAVFLDKAMSKEADQRYQNGDDFAAALRAAFAGRPAPASSGSVDMDLGV